MAKTYEIWRKSDPVLDRYDISNYTKILDVEALGEIELNTERYNDEVFYRSELVSPVLFSGASFYNLLCIKYDPVVNGMIYLLVIKDGASIYWKGFISLTKGEWDESECTVSMPITVFDEYSKIIDTFDIKKNVLRLVSPKTSYTILGEAWFQFLIETGSTPPAHADGYTLAYTKTGTPNTYIFARHRCSAKMDGFLTVDESDTIVYAKSPIPAATVLGFYIVESATQPPDVGGVSYIKIGTMSGTTFWTLETTIDNAGYADLYEYETQSYPNALFFNDVVDELIVDYGFIGFQSEYLKDINNPITGAVNKLDNLLLSQGSDASNPTATEKATIMELSMSDLSNILKVLNARWYIDSVGDFRIEHIKYFENNLSYSVAKTVGINATLKEDARTGVLNIIRTNKYNYNTSKAFKYETFSWSAAETENFIGTKIYYDSETVNNDNSGNTNEFQSVVTTDVPFLLAKPSQIPDTSIFLLQTIVDGVNNQVQYEGGAFDNDEPDYPSPLTEIKNLPNNHLSWANLHDKYYKYGRILLSGFMNDNPTVFQSNVPIIQQEEISFALCPDTLDPLKLITTFIGDGEIISATENMRTGTLRVVLEYRAIDSPRICACISSQPIQIGTWIVEADCQAIS